jgi:LmbE family N-acetylglucosaminyl deacetylase
MRRLNGDTIMISSRRASLLVVLAHPDDELFHGGMLSHLSERGVRVTLACATNGEAGKPHPSVGSVDDLGALRVEELRLSCDRLGIEPPVLLGFHDSARGDRQRYGDPRALANVDMLEVEAAIRRIILDVKPQVLLTFDPHGGYYHPDHAAVQRATTAAFFSSGMMGEAAPERLFYGAMLRDVFRVLADESRGRGITDGLDPDVFGTAEGMIAVSFDATALVHRKFRALAAHRSAFGVTEEMLSAPPPGTREMLDAFRPVFEREVFVLGGTRVPMPHWPLRDLFDGIHITDGPRWSHSEGPRRQRVSQEVHDGCPNSTH